MMSKKSPQLRFKGFTDAWEELKLGDAVSISSGVTGDAALQDGKYRLTRIESISQGMLNVARLGFTNEKPDQKYLLNLGDILYSNINSLSHIGKVALVDTTGIYHGINLLRFQMRNGVDSEFLFQRLNTMPMKNWAVSHANPAVSQASINQTELSKQPISSPTLTEQQQIGNFFKEIDNIIGLHQRKLDLLKEQKKGYLQKMFPKAGEKIPELRFEGFADDWEERKLGDITKISTGKLDANAMVENGKYDFYTSGIKKYRIDVAAFEGPSITIAGNGATVGYMHLADNKFNAYQRTYVLQEFLVDRSFIFSEIGNKLPKKIKQEARTGNIPYIVMDMLTELKLSIPQNNSEQQKIGSFFKQLDDTIDLHQRKLDLFKEQKKGFLQKMFV